MNRLTTILPGTGSHRMVAVMTVITAALLLGLGWLSQRYVQGYQQHIAQSQQTLTLRIAHDLDGRIDAAMGAMEEVAKITPPSVLTSSGDAHKWLESRVGIKRAFYSGGMLLADQSGRILTVLADLPETLMTDEVRKWVKKTIKLEEPLISPPFRLLDKGNNTLMVMVGVPIIDVHGQVMGMMGGFMPVHSQSLLGRIDRMTLGTEGYFFVTSWNGQLLLHPDQSLLLRQDVHPIPTDVLNRASQGQRVTVETVDHTGQAVLSAFTKMQSTGWVLGSNVPLAEAYAPIRSFQREAVISVLLGVGLVALVTWAMMRLFVAPITRLAQDIATVGVSAGSLLSPVSVNQSEHEVAQVATAINQMIDRINRAGAQARLASAVFESACEGIVVTDDKGCIVSVNRAFTDITGFSAEEAMGQTPRFLRSGRHDQAFYQEMWWSITNGGSWRGEIWNRRKSGEIFPELLHINAVRDAQGTISNFVAIFSDITDIKATQRQLETMATMDPLTGLPNRTLLADRLAQSMAQARRQRHLMVVGFIDLDGFKAINDREGHHMGDLLLVEVAARFLTHLREGDTIARLGGDEFVLILNDVAHMAAARLVLDRILVSISQPYHIQGRELRISASIGVTHFPTDNVDAETLMRHADQAMYQAKNLGRGRIHIFDADHDRAVQTRYQEVEQIRAAMTAGQMELYYQPKVDLRDGRVIGVEALLRWNHPERGLLTPPNFLGMLSGHAIELDIGEWVIDQALHQRSRWINEHQLPLSISVNLTATHLLQPDFVDRLLTRMQDQVMDQGAPLEIEMLETDAVRDVAQVRTVIERCRTRGVQFSIDDFGTGYSSLSYLRAIPVDMLKIDRSFVLDMLDDEDDLAIVKGVINLAAVFRCKVIAEGVETDQHAQALLDAGCHLGQGFGIAYPMPAHQVAEWMAKQKLSHQPSQQPFTFIEG